MEQQTRFNTNKPRLSYFFCNARALVEMTKNHSGVLVVGRDLYSVYAHVVDLLVAFLSAGPDSDREDLAAAVFSCVGALQRDMGGEPLSGRETATELLMSASLAVDEFVKVCDHGEKKYTRGNYRLGAPITEYLDSALRHLRKRLNGEVFDEESKLPHGGHALWNLWQALDQPDFRDDRLPAVVTHGSSTGNVELANTDALPPPPSIFDGNEDDEDAVQFQYMPGCSCHACDNIRQEECPF